MFWLYTIKKYVSILLAVLLVACCLSAAGEGAALQLAGTWIETEGYGTLTIFSDCTAVMYYSDGTVEECTWEVTELGGKFTSGSWEEGAIQLMDENTLSVYGWLIFAREGTEAVPADLQPVPVGEEGEPFLGTWTLSSMCFDGTTFSAADFGMSMEMTFNADGTATSVEDGETNIGVWSVENGAVMVDGLALTINEEGQLVLEEDGAMMIFVQGEVAESAELSEEELLLALLEMMGEETDLPEHLQGYVGTWHMVYTATGGLTGDLRTMGVTCTLDLYSDGTGSIDFPDYEYGDWYEDEGVVRFGENGMPMTLLEGGFLQYGTEMGGYMIFSQDAEAVYTPAAAEPAAETETPAAPAGEVFSSHEDYLGRKFTAETYSMGGQTYDAALLGAEYSLLFRADGTCDFVMAGAPLTDLP